MFIYLSSTCRIFGLYNICSGQIPYEYYGAYFVVEKKSNKIYNEKRPNHIRKNHIEQLHSITKLLDIKDSNIQFVEVINRDTHKEIIAKLDYKAPSCPDCGSLMKKYYFQKPSKIPYLETTGLPTRILLKKR